MAASRDIGTYPRTGGLVHDLALRAFLNLPADRRIAAVIYVGYPAITPERRRTPWQEKTVWLREAAHAVATPGDRVPVGAASGSADGKAIAIDPVCKMEVEIATAEYTSEYDGTTFYFCAPGCKAAFDENPAVYVRESS